MDCRTYGSSLRTREAEEPRRALAYFFGVHGAGSGQATPTTLGHPSLEWPSTREDEARTGAVIAGAERPITLGYFLRVRRDAEDELHFIRERDYKPGEADAWYLKLTIGLDINDNRDKLRPEDDGYVINLLVGAEDGAARSFTVSINWDATRICRQMRYSPAPSTI